ncbi:RNA polymerase sigma factor (sigma-70 family) [Nocardioides luteus]|uniref:RNA polymerase sigma-70 region 2 domain-containing protein n=1 Tax=Nocardioides luteus TaxID=1844 RepID=A0ABQ5SV36_9ACTN|nr:sigma-70 family RNA polymerase sigma factor [Nocardioides luteus]MDR7311810.1 RNA polymerase sigma factor (sigma-70 family) [Nocardioides luteus]GGR71740.1 hypothetical protein GCM10010197_44000 [Nocardioides luteus]GLJ68053.1 hypothetical protein GCM10017579_20890 [Nocardioides luteus]
MSESTPTTLSTLDAPGDAELITAVRGGDVDAYGALFERHVEAARRLARQLVSAGDVDDLVSEAFAKVLNVLQRGGGPDLAFRAYLLTSLRRLHVDKIRAASKLTTTDDMTPFDPGVPFEDTAVSGFDNQAAARAFQQLPERWQQVLWHTEVEGQKPAEIAPMLGMSANSVSALAYRAREGLKQAFISMHAQDAVEEACATTRANLGAYIRNGLSKRDSKKVDDHLQDCRPCTAIYLELTEVNSGMGAWLAPALLGTAGAGYLAAGGVAAKGGLLLFFGRVKDWALGDPVGRTVAGGAGVAAAAAVVAGFALTGGDPTPKQPASDEPAAEAPADPGAADPGGSGGSGDSAPPADEPAAPPADKPADPADPPADSPADPPADTAPAQAQQPPVITTPLAPVDATPGGKTVIDLTKGATDANGDPLSVKEATVAPTAHGTVTKGGATGSGGGKGGGVSGAIFGGLRMADETVTTVTYRPDVGWRGTDTIEYVLTDGNGGEVSGSVEVTTPNADPKAVDDSATATVEGGNGNGQGNNGGGLGNQPRTAEVTVDVLANDTDDNEDTLELDTIVDQPAHGSAEIVDGKVRYTMEEGYTGDSDSFTYRISDGHGGKDVGTVRVTLEEPPPPSHDASIALDHIPYEGYEHIQVDADGIPEGEFSATLRYEATGVAQPYPEATNPQSMWACSQVSAPTVPQGGVVKGECTLTSEDNGQAVLHFDFAAEGAWTFEGSLTPDGYTDPEAGNDRVSASGEGSPTPTPSPSPTEPPDPPQVPTPPTTPDVPQLPTPTDLPGIPGTPGENRSLPGSPTAPSAPSVPSGSGARNTTPVPEKGAAAGGLTWKGFLKAIGIG